MSIKAFLFLCETDTAPDAVLESEDLILVADDEDERSFDPQELLYMTTLAVRSVSPTEVVQEFTGWYLAETKSEPRISFLGEELEIQSWKYQKIVNMEPERWSLSTSFVCYPKDMPNCRDMALLIIKESEVEIG